MNNKIYLTEKNEVLENLENKYNFLRNNLDEVGSLDSICLKKTADIAKMKKKNISSMKLEILLKEYRNYAIRTID